LALKLSIHEYLPIVLLYKIVMFPWSHVLEKVMSLSVWLGVRGKPRVKVHGIEECENY